MRIESLEPGVLWRHFAALAAVPRGSKNEAAAAQYVMKAAAERGIGAERDSAGNVVIRLPASPGHESAETVVLQGHLDMVCEKNAGTDHDFDNRGVRAVVDGEWVRAEGTTLGADNGIGVAAALALLDDRSAVHGPIEILLTIDEESGMSGAKALKAAWLKGRRMLNLDSEEDGTLYVGCAGGGNSEIEILLRRDPPPKGFKALRVEVSGLRGGHSGLNIGENRANAIKLLVRLLVDAADKMPLKLGSIDGGNKHNAIPREAWAVAFVPSRREDTFRKLAAEWRDVFRRESGTIEPGLRIAVAPAPPERPRPMTAPAARRTLDLLAALPHGALGMSQDLPNLVETSSNLAVAATSERSVRIVTSSRSSVAPTLRAVLGSIAAACRLAGVECVQAGGYPGWKPNMDSHLLRVARETCKAMYGADPKVTAIHAGLECGIIGEAIPGMDMLSFGPQIEGAHSPDERVRVASVARFYDFLKGVLRALA